MWRIHPTVKRRPYGGAREPAERDPYDGVVEYLLACAASRRAPERDRRTPALGVARIVLTAVVYELRRPGLQELAFQLQQRRAVERSMGLGNTRRGQPAAPHDSSRGGGR